MISQEQAIGIARRWSESTRLYTGEFDALLVFVRAEMSRVNADTPPLGILEGSLRAVLLLHISGPLGLSLEAAEKLCDAAGWPS